MKKIFTFITFVLCILSANADTLGTRVYLLGDATPSGWNLNNDMTLMECVEEGKFQWIGDLKEGYMRFKVNCTNGDWKNCYGPQENGTELATGEIYYFSGDEEGEAPNYKVSTAGYYKLELDCTGETAQLTVSDATGMEPTHVVAEHPHYVYAIGSATAYGWDLDTSKYSPLKETAFDSGIYTGLVEFQGEGEFKILLQADWGTQFGPAGNGEELSELGQYDFVTPTDDNKWSWKMAGTYFLTVDVNEMKLTVADETAAGIKNVKAEGTACKYMEKGRLVIERNGVRYGVDGTRM